jgi:hypothetical protein
VGALTFSLVWIPALGSRGSQQLLIWISAAAAAFAIAAAGIQVRERMRLRTAMMFTTSFPGVVVLAWGMSMTVSDIPWQVIAYGRRVAPILRGLDVAADPRPSKPVFIGEGISASVVINRQGITVFMSAENRVTSRCVA